MGSTVVELHFVTIEILLVSLLVIGVIVWLSLVAIFPVVDELETSVGPSPLVLLIVGLKLGEFLKLWNSSPLIDYFCYIHSKVLGLNCRPKFIVVST